MSRRKRQRPARTQNVDPVSDNGRLNLPGVPPDMWEFVYGPKRTHAITPTSVLAIPTYFRCLQILSKLPSLLKARVVEGYGKNIKFHEDHPVANMFNWSFDGGQTSAFVDRCFMQDQKHRLGNAVGEVLRNGRGEVAQIRWLQRDDFALYRDQNKAKRYEFRISNTKWSDPVEPRRVFHLPCFTTDGFIGRTVVSVHGELLERVMSSNDHRSEFFRQGGRPSGYLKKKKAIVKPSEKDEMRSEWQKAAPNGLAVLSDDTEYIALSLPPEDAKFLEGNKWDGVGICQIMGVPPYMAGIAGKETDIMAEELAIHFVLNTLMPEVRAIESEALKLFGSRERGDPRFRLELDLSGVLMASLSAQAEYFTKMASCAGLVPDEIRARTGYAPHPDGIGSTALVAGNNYVRLSDVVSGALTNKATAPANADPNAKPRPAASSSSAASEPDRHFKDPPSPAASIEAGPGLLPMNDVKSAVSFLSLLSPETKLLLSARCEQLRGKSPEEVDRSLNDSLK